MDILHPRPETFENHPERFFEKVVASSIWFPLHMLLLLSSVLVLAGQAALTRSIDDEPARMWARFGFALALVSNALVAVWLAFDSVGTRFAAERWVEAGPQDKEEFFRIGSALERVNFALDTLWFTLFWGLTFIVYGVALVLARRYPSWIGWVALAGGGGRARVVSDSARERALDLDARVRRGLRGRAGPGPDLDRRAALAARRLQLR